GPAVAATGRLDRGASGARPALSPRGIGRGREEPSATSRAAAIAEARAGPAAVGEVKRRVGPAELTARRPAAAPRGQLTREASRRPPARPAPGPYGCAERLPITITRSY